MRGGGHWASVVSGRSGACHSLVAQMTVRKRRREEFRDFDLLASPFPAKPRSLPTISGLRDKALFSGRPCLSPRLSGRMSSWVRRGFIQRTCHVPFSGPPVTNSPFTPSADCFPTSTLDSWSGGQQPWFWSVTGFGAAYRSQRFGTWVEVARARGPGCCTSSPHETELHGQDCLSLCSFWSPSLLLPVRFPGPQGPGRGPSRPSVAPPTGRRWWWSRPPCSWRSAGCGGRKTTGGAVPGSGSPSP